MLRRTVSSCAPWWRLCRSKRGVLLVDYVMSVAVGAMLAALVCAGLGRTAISWQHLLEQLELAQAGSYMQGVLEKQLTYNATAIRIRADGNLELVTLEDNDGTFVASFRALEDGETVVSFSYAKDDVLEEIRALNVTCKDGKVADVSNASVMPISGQDDPEITDLRNSNSIPMIMKEHSAVTCVSETWDGENNWQNKTVRQFVSSDGRLWYDYEQYDDADQVVYCEAGYINDDVPGALYTCEKDGLKTMTLCPASEYEAMVSDRWLARQPYDYETVADKTDSTEYGTTTLTAARQNGLTGINSEVIYFIDDATGLITGMEVTEHSAEDGSVVSVTRSNILYDEPRLMEEQAAMNILFPEDACYLNVIINPGKENSEEQAFHVDKSTEVEFDAMEGYQLYYDYDCTQPMDWIDVGQNKLTVYVTIDPAK